MSSASVLRHKRSRNYFDCKEDLTTHPDIVAIVQAIISNDMIALHYTLQQVHEYNVAVRTHLYNACAQHATNLNVCIAVYNRFIERIWTNSASQQSSLSMSMYQPSSPMLLHTALKYDNKMFLQFINQYSAHHENFFNHALKQRCSLPMIQFIQAEYGILGSTSVDLSSIN